MRKRNSLIITIAIFVIVISLTLSLFIENEIGSKITEIVTLITALVGAIALFVQFKKDKDLNQATFIMEFSKAFFDSYNCKEVFLEINRIYGSEDEDSFDFKKYESSIIDYLLWIESLSAVVMDNVVSIKNIDRALNFRFFVLANNKTVQQNELVKYKQLYKGTYALYDLWYKYRKKKHLEIPREDNSLHLTEGYNENLKY